MANQNYQTDIVKPTFLEYIIPMWGQATYYDRLCRLEESNRVDYNNNQVRRAAAKGFFLVPLVNLAIGAAAIAAGNNIAEIVESCFK